MKKIVLLVSLISISLSSFSQLTIIEDKDEMTDKSFYQASERFIAANSEKNKGCAIDMLIEDKNGVVIANNMIVKMVGLESCNENNNLIFLFEDGSKLNLNSWNKFNCKATAYFSLTKEHIELLSEKPISKVRITNGRSFKNYTSEIEYKNYFIDLYKILNK